MKGSNSILAGMGLCHNAFVVKNR